MKPFFILSFFLVTTVLASAQRVSGVIQDEDTHQPIGFVNVGIAGKNIGSVSNERGFFDFAVGGASEEKLLISCIGYIPSSVSVSEMQKEAGKVLFLKKKTYSIQEVVIKPKKFVPKTLGNTHVYKQISAGFTENTLGHELGVLMKSKKSAHLKKVNIQIANCAYDTIHYRLNVYRAIGENEFENILKEPIYIHLTRSAVHKVIQVDVENKNIVVDGDFLVTLEHVRDLGKGGLYFCSGLGHTYYRKTSQGNWVTTPIGIGISATADVEK